eukprot:TRINITY_DN2869_c2_g5_i1.p1 TRINITY_DN2869_c2_g5~~TRINITY_DN2869_c2_g5_i1.p1  ORF type:complete len:336 (+),score=82.16 TRINITY_DN2869_c2_g5_i1:3-1010(+)
MRKTTRGVLGSVLGRRGGCSSFGRVGGYNSFDSNKLGENVWKSSMLSSQRSFHTSNMTEAKIVPNQRKAQLYERLVGLETAQDLTDVPERLMTSWLGGRKGRKQKKYLNTNPNEKRSAKSAARKQFLKDWRRNKRLIKNAKLAKEKEERIKAGIPDPYAFNPEVDAPTDPENPPWKGKMGQRWDHPGRGPFYIGTVTGTKMQKTAMVTVKYIYRKHKFGSTLHFSSRTTNFMSHDPDEITDVGDVVEIRMSRPYSKRKKWIVTRILEKDKGVAFITKNPEFNIVQRRSDLKFKTEKLRELDMLEHNISVIPRAKVKEMEEEQQLLEQQKVQNSAT